MTRIPRSTTTMAFADQRWGRLHVNHPERGPQDVDLVQRDGSSSAWPQSTCRSISRPPSGTPAESSSTRYSPVGGGDRSREKGITAGLPAARLRVSGTNVGSGLEGRPEVRGCTPALRFNRGHPTWKPCCRRRSGMISPWPRSGNSSRGGWRPRHCDRNDGQSFCALHQRERSSMRMPPSAGGCPRCCRRCPFRSGRQHSRVPQRGCSPAAARAVETAPKSPWRYRRSRARSSRRHRG